MEGSDSEKATTYVEQSLLELVVEPPDLRAQLHVLVLHLPDQPLLLRLPV
jgi:hypothetical protein